VKLTLHPVVAVAVAIGLSGGCGGKKEEAPSIPPAAVQRQPPSAPATPPGASPAAAPAPSTLLDIQADINKALALAKEGKHAEALALLQELLTKQNLTTDQKLSIEKALAQIKQWAAEAVTKSVTEKSPLSLPKPLPLK